MIFSNLNFPKKMFFLENIIFGGFPEFCCLYVFFLFLFCFYYVCSFACLNGDFLLYMKVTHKALKLKKIPIFTIGKGGRGLIDCFSIPAGDTSS